MTAVRWLPGCCGQDLLQLTQPAAEYMPMKLAQKALHVQLASSMDLRYDSRCKAQGMLPSRKPLQVVWGLRVTYRLQCMRMAEMHASASYVKLWHSQLISLQRVSGQAQGTYRRSDAEEAQPLHVAMIEVHDAM